jgi:predicted nucleic acid-binding Zn ribbon protein
LTSRLAPAGTLARVQAVWAQAVGEAIAGQAVPVGEHDGELRIRCASATWAQELELMGPGLAAKLNEALGEGAIRGLRCEVR